MAEPLTSSDILRERMGFGVSPLASQETRRAYAAAGLSPLGTQERERFARGGALSPMATQQEQEAWKQAEFMAGSREQAPISYGGIGDRPVGTSRRAIRMQAEWDKQQQEQLQNQRLMQQMDMEQKTYEINRIKEERMQRAEQSAIDAALAKESRDLAIQEQADSVMKSILGTTTPDGQRIRPININDDDAVERLQSAVSNNQLGMENQAVKEVVTGMLNDALNIRQKNLEQSQQQELAAINLSVKTGRPFQEFGTYNERGIFQPRAQGMIAGAEEVKAGEEAKAQEATIATEKRRAETAADVAEERDKKARRKQLDEDILTEEQTLIDFQNQKQSPSRDTEIKKAEAKLKNLHLRRGAIEGLTSDDLIYKDQDAYRNAVQGGKKIPSGTTIYIGGIPAKVK